MLVKINSIVLLFPCLKCKARKRTKEMYTEINIIEQLLNTVMHTPYL